MPKTKTQINNGITSETIRTKSGQRVHIASVDRHFASIEIVSTDGKLLKPSKIAEQHDAAIAINGGFFHSDGRAASALKLDGKWISYPKKLRGAIGINPATNEIFFDRLIHHGDHGFAHATNHFAKDGWWETTPNILGGAPLLMSGGMILDPAPEETLPTFLSERYARTAICECADKTIKLVVVNGGDRNVNKFLKARGMSIQELQEFLKSLGCISALNLDGGYSSAYILQGKKQNSFSVPLPERKVSTAIIVRPKKL